MNNTIDVEYSHLVDENGNIIYSDNPSYKITPMGSELVTITKSNDSTATTSTITIGSEYLNRHERRKALAKARRNKR